MQNKKVILFVLIIILAAMIVAGLIFFGNLKMNSVNKGTVNQTAAQAADEVKRLTTEVGKLMVLPTGEDPTIATITDANLLKGEQPFYAGAQNGDKLLVYILARKAIIYREAQNKIINAGPLFIQNTTTTPATSATPTTPTPKK